MRRLNPRVSLLRESPTRRIDAIKERLASERQDIFLLSTGQPSIPPPVELREYLSSLLMEEDMRLYGYTQSQGIGPLREAIAEDLRGLGGLDLDADKNIVVTAGGQEAMFVTLAAILEEGDEVVLMDPTYFGYRPLIEYFGGRVQAVEAGIEEGYQPVPEAIAERIGDRTKAIVIVTPDNPTGRVLDHGVGRALADMAQDHNLWLVVDEAYKTIVYEGSHFWFWKYQPERVIAVNTFSKDPSMPGWRLGYVYGPEGFIRSAKLLSEEVVYCPPSFAQLAVTYYLRSGLRKSYLPKVLEVYRRRRDALSDALLEYLAEARFMRAQGSMFIMADFQGYLERLGVSSDRFSEALLEETGVAVIPGSFFGAKSHRYIRFSFVSEPEERIWEAVRKIRGFIDKRGM